MKKYTLKKDGKYWSAIGPTRGFLALGIGGCYSYDLAVVRELQAMVGGEIVEVIHLGGFRYAEGKVEETGLTFDGEASFTDDRT